MLNSQSLRQFGNSTKRTRQQFIADQFEGKLAEIAMQKFLSRLGITIGLNFTHYLEPSEVDGGDIEWILVGDAQIRPRLRVDAKGTGRTAAWLLVEQHKFTADIYLLMKFIDLPEKKEWRDNPAILKGQAFHAVPAGWALSDDFRCPKTGGLWFEYKEGASLYHPDCLPVEPPASKDALREHIGRFGPKYLSGTLEASINYGLPIAWLRKDWVELRRRLLQSVSAESIRTARKQCERIHFAGGTGMGERPSAEPQSQPARRSALARELSAVNPAYSLVIFAGPAPVPEDALCEIVRLLRQGVKVILAGQCPDPADEVVPFIRARLFEAYLPGSHDCSVPTTPVLIVDGRPADERVRRQLEELESKWRPAWENGSSFNYRQYEVEHADPAQHLAIRAGAGTGKTTVMVNRVLYLLHVVPDLSPREIVMITFTRDAANEMRKRLRAALVERYRLCANRRDWYRWCLEQLGEMQIQTIHAFARSLMTAVGSIAGLGSNVTLREFRLERQRILEEIVNEKVDLRKQISSQLAVPIYKFVEVADKYWTEIENKGLTLDDIKRIDWGKAEGESAAVQQILSGLFVEAERRLTELKQRINAISLKDLIRWLDGMKGRILEIQQRLGSSIRFLFVDEFQDTDDSQIRLILWLQRELRPRPSLFVVGDVKQSIYRFRGANWTAFEMLEKGAKRQKADLRTIRLIRNYRTDSALLDDMHPIFERWGEKGLLPYQPHDRLIGDRPGGRQIEWVYVWPKEELKPKVLRIIRACLEEVKQSSLGKAEPDQVAVLVRRNRQAQEIRAWCDSDGIDCQVETGGDFYTTAPVIDFLHLVSALLFPTNPTALLNLYQSPYSRVSIDLKPLVGNTNPEAILGQLKPHPPLQRWETYLKQLRLRPALSVLRTIIDETDPAQVVYQRRRTELLARGASAEEAKLSAEIEAVKYSRNLDKLIRLLHERFAADGATLYAIHEFLAIKRATDRDEDQAPPTELEKRAPLVCKTVHKAKGQEYHTVIIPYTTSSFTWSRSELLLRFNEQAQRWQAGWCLKLKDSNSNENDTLTNYYYKEFESREVSEVEKEETRLLYVAMTRAIKRLIVVVRLGTSKKCWSALLQ